MEYPTEAHDALEKLDRERETLLAGIRPILRTCPHLTPEMQQNMLDVIGDQFREETYEERYEHEEAIREWDELVATREWEDLNRQYPRE